MALCTDRNSRQEPCGAHATEGSDKCFLHGNRKAAQAARKKGGRNRQTPSSAPPPEWDTTTVDGLQRLLRYTIEETLRQTNSATRSKVLLAAVETGQRVFQLGDDVAALRAFVEEVQRKEAGR
jgi:hypothetical protein